MKSISMQKAAVQPAVKRLRLSLTCYLSSLNLLLNQESDLVYYWLNTDMSKCVSQFRTSLKLTNMNMWNYVCHPLASQDTLESYV